MTATPSATLQMAGSANTALELLTRLRGLNAPLAQMPTARALGVRIGRWSARHAT
jgi:hypothetical protein